MLMDDVIYIVVLLTCTAFGTIFRRIKDCSMKQWTSTAAGVFVSTLVSGWHIIHPISMTILIAGTLSVTNRRTRHLASFFLSFFYLLVVSRLTEWYGVVSPPTHTNLILMIMTLRFGGLGFEINAAEDELKDDPNNESCKMISNIGFFDVIHYGFGYMGVLTGPYYRYRTFWDCMNRNLGEYIDCKSIALHKLKLIVVTTILYLMFNHFFPPSYAVSDEFLQRSFLYRACYVYPGFMVFRTRIYSGMLFSECVCHMAGMGIYPTTVEVRPGLGPKNYKAFTEILSDPEKLKKEQMNFESIHNINIWGVETTHSIRQAMKYWNTTVQYWMAFSVYKPFPLKAFRMPAVFLISSLWHGYAFGYYVAIFSVVFFLPAEDVSLKIYNSAKEGTISKKIWFGILYYMRITCMAYLSFAMLLLSYDNIMVYYNSIMWYGHIITGTLYVTAILLKPHLVPKVSTKEE